MRRFICSFLLLLCAAAVSGQTGKSTLSGYVREKGSGELLPGVTVFFPELQASAISNNYGFYSITVPAGTYRVIFSFVGYQSFDERTDLSANRQLDVELDGVIELDEVVIVTDRVRRATESAQMSTINIPISQLRNIPSLLGEKDVLKALQLLPGVQSGQEGSTGLYVRGGGPDQNLIILDDAPVYNANHLFGFFSIFNSAALKSVELTKGGFPARFGGRLSSVVEMTMKDGNKEKFGGEFSLGLLSANLSLEGPIVKNKCSFLVSARRTYLDFIIKPFMEDDVDAGYYFYDLNAKVNYDFGRKNKLYLSGYFGRDKFYINDTDTDYKSNGGLYWQNATGTLRWNHLFNDQWFANTSLIYSNYSLHVTEHDRYEGDEFSLDYSSGIRDFSLKYDMEFHPSPFYTLRTGFLGMQHLFTPSAMVRFNTQQPETNYNSRKQHTSYESGVYAENIFNFRSRAQVNAGLRFSHFYADGQHYCYLEPRISANYKIAAHTSIKAAYAEMSQYIHLLSSTGIGLPTDLWVPSTNEVRPQRSRQVSAGIAHELSKTAILISLESYYKQMKSIIGYLPGASFVIIDDPMSSRNFSWEDNITAGQGKSYGVELLLQKQKGRFNGWIGYTLSWTRLQFDDINFGEWFWARYDRRHDISLVGIYELSRGITLSGTWVYGTGNAITMPQGAFVLDPSKPFPNANATDSYIDYGDYNGLRMRDYHRLDLGIQFHKHRKNYTRTWEIGIYNVYNRKNPFYYETKQDDQSGVTKLYQYSIFPMVPSISFQIKF